MSNYPEGMDWGAHDEYQDPKLECGHRCSEECDCCNTCSKEDCICAWVCIDCGNEDDSLEDDNSRCKECQEEHDAPRGNTGATTLKGLCETCWGHGKLTLHSVDQVCLALSLDCPTCDTRTTLYLAKEKPEEGDEG